MPYSKHPPNYQHLADISHRADALTSLVALTSILGSSFGGYTFLDPLGGLAVSFFILQQGLSLSKVAMLELLDAGVDKPTQKKIELLVEGLVDGKDLLGVRNVRGVKSGGKSSHLPTALSLMKKVRHI
jgi:divalent metal cation (Fe/Co/Zn/Cd) transporter